MSNRQMISLQKYRACIMESISLFLVATYSQSHYNQDLHPSQKALLFFFSPRRLNTISRTQNCNSSQPKQSQRKIKVKRQPNSLQLTIFSEIITEIITAGATTNSSLSVVGITIHCFLSLYAKCDLQQRKRLARQCSVKNPTETLYLSYIFNLLGSYHLHVMVC